MSRIKCQDSRQNCKTPPTSVDFRKRTHSHDKTVAEISLKDFLDFLKISYQVNEAIDNPSLDVTEKGSVDWKKLTSDTLISRLKEREALLSRIEKSNPGPQEKTDNTNSEAIPEAKAVNNSKPAKKVGKSSGENVLEKKWSEQLPESISSESFSSTLSLDRKLSLERSRKKNLKADTSTESETSRSLDGAEDRGPVKQLKKKLSEVLQEGILDSVLPYLLPKQAVPENVQASSNKKGVSNETKKSGSGSGCRSGCVGGSGSGCPSGSGPGSGSGSGSGSGKVEKQEKPPVPSPARERGDMKRKPFYSGDMLETNDLEVVIHVCDEVKNLKRDFKCSQKLLLSQMGYFAEVTAGQKLEDMDISVHCDIIIFDWLMQWIQKDSLGVDNWPVLDPTIAVPVLMSSTFLQMNSLYEFCLYYCKNHINDIIRESPNLTCINDNVLTRLATLFSNSDVESIVDKKDKIQSRLFCKLIVALTEPEPQPSRGHYSSLATIYRCSKCLKLILKNMSNVILCVASNMKMDRYGTIYSTHVYDSSWNLSDYVRDLKTTLKTWRRVYWRLWADCHLLFCQVCEEYFSVGHMSCCAYHVETVQYIPLESHKPVLHYIGRFPCCGERVYRFEAIKKSSGCQFRDHVVSPKNNNDSEIFRLWHTYKDVITNEPSPLFEAEKIKLLKPFTDDGNSTVNNNKNGFWWNGLEIVPSKQTCGFLNKVLETVIKKDEYKNGSFRLAKSFPLENSASIDQTQTDAFFPDTAGNNSEVKNSKTVMNKLFQQCSVQDISSLSDSSEDSCSSLNAGNSEESCHASKTPAKSKSSSYCFPSRLSYLRKEKRRRKKKKKKTLPGKIEGSRFWLSKLSTRCNQDNQREFEERALRQLESVLAKKLSGESFKPSGSRSNYQVMPSGGIYVKLEQEWREAHCFSHGCPGSSVRARGSGTHLNVNNSNFSARRRSKSRGHR